MERVLLLTGAVVWTIVVVLFALRVLKRVGGGRLRIEQRFRQLMNKRLFFPYSSTIRSKGRGVWYTMLRAIMPISRELAKAYRQTKVSEMRLLRDAMDELDTLPTVKQGNAALGISTVFDLPVGYWHVKSQYTSPQQYPPFFVPGVPAKPFYDPSEFAFTKILEDNYPIIKDELMQLLARDAQGFKGYVSEGASRVSGWNTFNFFFLGKKFEENCDLCPRTTAILESLPRFEKDHIMFSSLNPHSRIRPHTGPMNGILRAHLGLVVPKGCFIRVGNEEHSWEEGKVMVFDDSFEHEVWNHSDYVRIVLFLNFWHPCFSDQEIKALERYRTAYEQNPVARLHADIQAAKATNDLATKKVVTKPAAA